MNDVNFKEFQDLFSTNEFMNLFRQEQNVDGLNKKSSQSTQKSSVSPTKVPAKPLSGDEIKINLQRDKSLLINYSEAVISGYLNLKESDGWKEGSDHRIGVAFSRYILGRYLLEEKQNLGCNEQILTNVIHSFSDIGDINQILPYLNHASVHPQNSRACYDPTATGWKVHTVSRMVGSLGSTYDPSKPAFEILVNSARTSLDDPLCQPFYITVYKNEKELEERRKLLASLNKASEANALGSYYSIFHQTAGMYLKENQSRLGPNSTHLLKGLEFLENTTIAAQKTGNCWIKQPMRCLLTSIYIETLTERSDLTPQEAWEASKTLYKSIQKIAAIPCIQDLMGCSPMTKTMRQSALQGIEKQKNL